KIMWRTIATCRKQASCRGGLLTQTENVTVAVWSRYRHHHPGPRQAPLYSPVDFAPSRPISALVIYIHWSYILTWQARCMAHYRVTTRSQLMWLMACSCSMMAGGVASS